MSSNPPTGIFGSITSKLSRLTVPEIIALGIVAVVLIVGIVMAKDKISDWWHGHRQAQFDAQMAEAQKKVAELQGTNDQLRMERDAANAKAADAEIAEASAKQQLAQLGKAGADAARAEQAAQDQYAKDQISINANSSMFDRCNALCASRASVGYPCKPTAVQFCSAFAGR